MHGIRALSVLWIVLGHRRYFKIVEIYFKITTFFWNSEIISDSFTWFSRWQTSLICTTGLRTSELWSFKLIIWLLIHFSWWALYSSPFLSWLIWIKIECQSGKCIWGDIWDTLQCLQFWFFISWLCSNTPFKDQTLILKETSEIVRLTGGARCFTFKIIWTGLECA